MKIIDIDNIKDSSVFGKQQNVNGVSFLNKSEIDIVLKAANNDVNTIRNWFDIINIRYDKLYLVAKMPVYIVDGEELFLSNLSSGERFLLYIIACKQLEMQIVAKGLFERLDSKLTPNIIELLRCYKNLTVITYNRYPIELKDCMMR